MSDTQATSNLSGDVGSVGSVGYLDGLAELLDELRTWLNRYIEVVNKSDLDVLTLWIMHTWALQETYTSPRLLIESPLPESGKTTLLEHLGKLCFSTVQMASISSPALLSRITETPRTLLIDEVDRTLSSKKPGIEEVVAILNSGYKRGATRPVLVKGKDKDWEASEVPTYSAVAMAGNNPPLPDDTRSRCLVVRLLPDKSGRVAESDWELIDPQADALAEAIKEMAEVLSRSMQGFRPEMPPECRNRARERWQPLKRIAALASASWSNRTDEAILQNLEQEKEARESGESQQRPALVLLTDLYKIYDGERGFLPTTVLVERLKCENPEHWSYLSNYGKDLTPQRLGQLLARFLGLTSKRIGDSPRGYHSDQFQVTWERMGIAPAKPTESTEPTEPTEVGGLL